MRRVLRRMLSCALIVPLVAGGAAPQSAGTRPHGGPPDTMEARIQGCVTCHGGAGQGTKDDYFPRIAGKPRGYLFNQLQNFREGRRSYPPMNYLLAYLQDDYLGEIAQYFAQRQVPFEPSEGSKLTAAQLAAGQALVMQGDTRRGIPACSACHGAQLMGINPGIPGLIGLHSRYISAQLEAWRAGTRRAASPDCMHDIATRLSEEQITAVAGWLAAQPAPTKPEPAPPGQWKTPLVCGSQPG
jgi:cytochrome c553